MQTNITFNDVPQALSLLLEKVSHLEHLIETQQQPQQAKESKQWMNLKDLQEYLPDHPAAPTVYGWIRNNLIPYYKTGKKLSFKKSEIDEWLNATRSKTDAEIEAEAINYINDRRLGK